MRHLHSKFKNDLYSCWFFIGFTVDFENPKNQSSENMQTFTVKFDPQGANLNLGYTSAVLPVQVHTGIHLFIPINTFHSPSVSHFGSLSLRWFSLLLQVTGGPVVHVRLCAVVTRPAVTASSDKVQFDTLQCGMCQVLYSMIKKWLMAIKFTLKCDY